MTYVEGSDGEAVRCPRSSPQPLVTFASQPRKQRVGARGTGQAGCNHDSLPSAQPRQQVVCFLAAFITGLSDATHWLQYLAIWRKLTALSLINQHSRGRDDCEGCKRSRNFLRRARQRGTGVQCAERRLRKHSVEPPVLSFLLVNPF